MNLAMKAIDLIVGYQDVTLKQGKINRFVEMTKLFEEKYGMIGGPLSWFGSVMAEVNEKNVIKTRITEEAERSILAELAMTIELFADPYDLSEEAEYKMGRISLADKLLTQGLFKKVVKVTNIVMFGMKDNVFQRQSDFQTFYYGDGMHDLVSLVRGNTLTENNVKELKDKLHNLVLSQYGLNK